MAEVRGNSHDLDAARSAYDSWHEPQEVDHELDSPWHRLVKKHLDPARDLDGKRVLEIGCGRGGLSCWLARQTPGPAEVVAADFSDTAVEKGREFAGEHGVTGVTWEVGDIQNIAHADAGFDTVISCETIEHVPDPRRAVRELARVLKPGGRLLVTTPNYLGTFGLYRCYVRLTGRRYTEVGQPINNFLVVPLTRRWIGRAGLRVTSVESVGHYLPLPRRRPLELVGLNKPRSLLRWFGLHSIIVAEKTRT